jgi:hypothetical protein
LRGKAKEQPGIRRKTGDLADHDFYFDLRRPKCRRSTFSLFSRSILQKGVEAVQKNYENLLDEFTSENAQKFEKRDNSG